MPTDRSAACLRALAGNHRTVASKFARLTPAEIGAVVQAIRELDGAEIEGWRDPRIVVLVRALFPNATELARRWKTLLALLEIRTLPCRTRAQQAHVSRRLRALASPKVAGAVRAMVVSDARWAQWAGGLELLPILALDDGKASVEALRTVCAEVKDPTCPHHAREALLESLAALSHFARRGGQVSKLLAQLQQEHASDLRTPGQSPATRLAKQLGLGAPRQLAFELHQESLECASDGTAILHVTCRVEPDPGDAADTVFMVAVRWRDTIAGGDRFRVRETEFGTWGPAVDDLQLGRCELQDLGPWLARAWTKLGLKLESSALTKCSIGGKQRQKLLAWLTPD